MSDDSAGVMPISLEDLGRLGIDRNDQLFWDGRPIEVRRRLVLTGLQRSAATVVTVFAVLGGLGGFLSGLNNLSLFLCARNVHLLGGCQAPPLQAATPK